MILALDPGRNLGLAWLSPGGDLMAARVVEQAALAAIDWRAAEVVVVGDGTGSAELQERLRALGVVFEIVDEAGTTLEGRALYFRDHPARGLGRLLPAGLRAPPRAIDDYAAYAIGLRYLRRRRDEETD